MADDTKRREFGRENAKTVGQDALQETISGFEFIIKQLRECEEAYNMTADAQPQIQALARAAQIAGSQLNGACGSLVRAAAKIAHYAAADALITL